MRKRFAIVVLFILLLGVLLTVYVKKRQDTFETFSVSATTEEEIKDELIIAIFMESITNNIYKFYSEYYSGQIMVYNYETSIVEIEKTENGFIYVRFGVTPQVGAHNPLGYDELLYSVDYAGKGKLIEYEHIENYDLPEKFQDYIIKPIGHLTSVDDNKLL